MTSSRTFAVALALSLAIGSAGVVRAGAPQPDTRAGEFVHVCQGGPNKGSACTVPTQDADCPRSACVVLGLDRAFKGLLTIVAHDTVTDWKNGGATNQAMTLLLEVKGPDGAKQMLAATYQDLTTPTNPPEALGNVVAIPMDEAAVKNLADAVGGLLFVQPESTLAQTLQTLFSSTGTPVIIAAADRRVELADHTGDDLATVLRFKVRIQFVEPL
jgi:hypothetical protein